MSASPASVRVATLNVRNTADRWRGRAGLLVDQLVELAPDVIGLQELRHFPDQGRWIVERADRRSNGHVRLGRWPAWKTGGWGWWEGITVLSGLAVTGSDILDLGIQHRVAQRVTVTLDGRRRGDRDGNGAGVGVGGDGDGDGAGGGGGGGAGTEMDFYNAHLATGDTSERETQARRLLEWMSERPGRPQVLVGDFNSQPDSPAAEAIREQLQSAYAVANGAEPDWTVPTPLRTAGSQTRRVLDYIFVNDLVEVQESWLVFDRPHPHNPRLMASDHLGLAAALSVPTPR